VSSPNNPAPVLPDFRDLASRIARTRSEFGRVYEEVRAAVPKSVASHTRPFIAVSAGATSDQVAFERALRLADEEGWFTQLSERLIHDEFFPEESASVTALQALISVELGFTDAFVVERGGLQARSRLCRVEVAKGGNPVAVTGTGFLVGPSAVLTSFHVVASLIDDQTDAPVPGSERQLRVRFDHSTGRREGAEYKVPQSWLVVRSRPHPAETVAVAGIEQLVSPAGTVDLSGFLDYAVIVVAGSPGAERGYYDLDRAVKPKSRGTIHLFQHPMGVPQRQTIGEFRGFRDPPNLERIDHTANAEVGSSGGLLLDANYQLVGLHQGAHGTPVVNTGISALAIRAHVQGQNANLLDSRFVQAFRVADGSRPILGRSSCQELIRRTSKPLVRVRPLMGGKGVSFTLEIMRACLPGSEHVIESVQVLELNSDAMRTAALLLSRLGVPAADLPTAPDASTSRGAWIGQLVASFGSRVQETHRDRTVWLLLDDLQKREHPIPDGSVRDFLSEVYTQSTNFKNLRIVLLGMTDFPSGFPTGFVDDEDISPPQLADIVSYIRLRLTAGGIDHSVAEVDRFAMLIELTCGADITSLSDYVADKVDRVLNTAIEALQ
jgi:Trypsin-like peptidase domain